MFLSILIFLINYPEYNLSALIYLPLSGSYFYQYFYTKKVYLQIDTYSVRKTSLFNRSFDYRKTTAIEKTYDYVMLHSENEKTYKINPDKINKDSKQDFETFISEIESNLKQHV